MNEKFIQGIIDDLGATIAQQTIEISILKANIKEFQAEIERLNEEIVKSAQEAQSEGADSVE